jgi:radical SAM protein with 4Fe4S-binding SPASM domain
LYVQFFPTFRCNDSCSFCFNRGIPAGPDIEVADFIRLADILAVEGIDEIDMLGGEPTLHPDLLSIVDSACLKGLDVSISSNGSNVPCLKALSENFDRTKLKIGISLNDAPPSDSLRSYIDEHRPMLKSVATTGRFIPDSAGRFIDMPGVSYYSIFMDTLHPSDLRNSLSFPRYARQLNDLKSEHENADGVYCSCFLPDIENDPTLEGLRCPAGTTKLSVMPDGSVYPCYLLFRRPEFRLGNILNDDFRDIIKRPVLDYFRTFTGNKCPEIFCEFFSRCKGGCPAVSLMITGDLSAPDPRCISFNVARKPNV